MAPKLEKLVIASGNPGKVVEIEQMLAPLCIEVLPQRSLKISEAEEPFKTFVENALAKARHASFASGLPALADDSGICVEAMGGAPGVFSARFAGAPGSDARNNARLLELLENSENRRAHYVCLMVLVRSPDDPQPLIAEGLWHGEILRQPRGNQGFGYDPLFLDPALGRTGAELDPAQKNRVSHRGKAMAALLARLREF